MARGPLSAVVHYIRGITLPPCAGDLSDAELVRRFAVQRDEAAFTALVQRHGPLVLGVCRRLLGNVNDAEDAFQATFLVLVRKAGSIGKRASVRSWLYSVACRVARRARATRERRSAREKPLPDVPAARFLDEVMWRDVREVLEEEVQRLPEGYRLPFLLWHLEGKTLEAIARELNWPLGTVSTRLTRARQRLRTRLARRGLGLAVALAAIALARNSAPAAVPEVLAASTIRAALRLAAGQEIADTVSPAVAGLTEGVHKAMNMDRLKVVAMVLLALGVLAAGAGLLAYQLLAAEPAGGAEEKQANAPQKPAGQRKVKVRVKVPGQRDSVVLMIGTEIKEGEKVPADQVVTVKVGDRVERYRRLQEGDTVEEGQLLARLDDRLARNQWAIQKQKVLIRKAEMRGAVSLTDVYKAEVKRLDEINRVARMAVSPTEYAVARAQLEKYAQEAVARKEAVKLAELEMEQARLILELYEIRSPARGVIRILYRQPGEAVKAFDPVVLIEVAPPKK
jgi:RNA polymerase sigma factor (sigma-70 family)